MKYLINTMLACLLLYTTAAQTRTAYHWWNPAENSNGKPEGQGWPQEGDQYYDRLPQAAKDKVRGDVFDLSKQSAGIILNFTTAATEILIEYMVREEKAFPHMPATGVSGIDLYRRQEKGHWNRATGKYAFGDTIRYRFTGLPESRQAAAFKLYLPLYNTVSWLRIGVPEGANFEPDAPPTDLPLVVYGTSIAQGACASRPGMAWTALLGRMLQVPVINLGFSGNGRLEPEVVSFLQELNAKAFILDCLPNLIDQSAEEVRKRTIATVETLSVRHPQTPILLTEHLGYGDEATNAEHAAQSRKMNEGVQAAFADLKKQGMRQIYLLTKKEIGMTEDSYVDGIHPNDAGMLQYARAYARKLAQIKP